MDPPATGSWRLGMLVCSAAGDSLRSDSLLLRNEKLLVDSALTGASQLPLTAALLLWFVPPGTLSDNARRDVENLAASRPSQDTLFIRKSGEWVKLEGILKAVDDQRVMFFWQDQVREVPMRLAAAVVLGGVQLPSDADIRSWAAVTGRDGSRFIGKVKGWNFASVTVISPGLGELTVPLDCVASVDMLWGRTQMLSELNPEKVAEAGYFGTVWHWRRNSSTSGMPLTIRRRVFERGVGVHARSSLTYRLDKKFALLTGSIGLDDAGGGRGRVAFAIFGDGRELFRTTMSASDEARRIRVPVEGVERLEILADFAESQDAGAMADWADMRLVK